MAEQVGRATSARRYDLDWIRVVGILGVFLFHNSMFFNSDGWYWHVKNAVLYPGMDVLSSFLDVWIMPLFFVISGISTSYALNVRKRIAFAKERVVRLVVPLLLGVVILSPPQVYIENVTHGRFAGSFWRWLPHYFDGWYSITPNGNFAWMGLHLWYLLILFLFSMLTLPLFYWLRTSRMQKLADRLCNASQNGWVLLLLALLPAAVYAGLNPNGAGAGAGGWPFLVYLVFYVYGFSLFSHPLFKAAIRKYGKFAIFAALVTLAGFIVYTTRNGYPTFGSSASVWVSLLRMLSCWCFLLAIFYLGDRYLNRNNKALQYCGRAVMPFYILHQPVIVFLGYGVREWPLSVWVKFPFHVVVSFVIVMGLYHFLVRKVNVLLFLFGMKPEKKARQKKQATKAA